MRRVVAVGLHALFVFVLMTPAFGQGGENNAYQAIQDEMTFQRKLQLIKDFIRNYSNSQYRPDLDIQLMRMYTQNKDWGEMLLHADSFRLTQPSADARSRVSIYTLAMVAAGELKNFEKVQEFGDRVLEADPNDLNALNMLTSLITDRLPQDAAARDAALNKALGYVKRAAAAPKPANIPDADWTRAQAGVKSKLGFIHLNKGEFAEAGKAYEEAVKGNPIDGLSQYRLGLAYLYQLPQVLQALQAAVKNLQEAHAAKADEKKLEELIAKQQELEKDVVQKRDLAIDALARAVAILGPAGAEARKQLEPLYANKNNKSLDGLDQFISSKKAELGL